MIGHMKLDKRHIHMTDEEFGAAIDESLKVLAEVERARAFADEAYFAVRSGEIDPRVIVVAARTFSNDQAYLEFFDQIGRQIRAEGELDE